MRGYYPSGKLREDDEGATLIQMGINENVIVIDFGRDLKWIGLYPDQAIEVANNLLRLANQIQEKIQ